MSCPDTEPILHKRGDTFTYAGELTSSLIADFTGCTVAALVTTSAGVTVGTAVIVVADYSPTLIYTLTISAGQTASWVPGETYSMDVQVTLASGSVFSTPTYLIEVVEDVT